MGIDGLGAHSAEDLVAPVLDDRQLARAEDQADAWVLEEKLLAAWETSIDSINFDCTLRVLSLRRIIVTVLILPGNLAQQIVVYVADEERHAGARDDAIVRAPEHLHILDLAAIVRLDDHRPAFALQRSHDHLTRPDVGYLVASPDNRATQDRLELLHGAAETADHEFRACIVFQSILESFLE